MINRSIQLSVAIACLLLHFNAAANTTSYNAAELTSLAQKAVSKVVDTAKQDQVLTLDSARAKPFWEAVKQLNESLEEVEKTLSIEDNEFFSALATAVAASQQAEIALLMIGSVSDSVQNAMKNASTLINTLDTRYSKEASRLAAGGKLSKAERKQLDKLKAQQKELLEKLDQLDQTVAKNNSEMKKSIDEIRRNSNYIRNSRASHADFCQAMFAARFITGALWGWHYWWGPWGYWGPGFINVNIVIWDSWVDDYIYDWALVQDTVDAIKISEEFEDIEYLAELDSYTTEDNDQWIENLEVEVDNADFVEITENLDPAGWDDVDTEQGLEVLEGYESNFGHSPYEQEFEMEVFDDMGGFDDFGGAFDLF